jgi:hypothetical protein
MAKLQLFQVAAILHPIKNDKGIDLGDSTLILKPEYRMAKSEGIAAQLVVRSLDDKYEPMLDRIDVLVRPF